MTPSLNNTVIVTTHQRALTSGETSHPALSNTASVASSTSSREDRLDLSIPSSPLRARAHYGPFRHSFCGSGAISPSPTIGDRHICSVARQHARLCRSRAAHALNNLLIRCIRQCVFKLQGKERGQDGRAKLSCGERALGGFSRVLLSLLPAASTKEGRKRSLGAEISEILRTCH